MQYRYNIENKILDKDMLIRNTMKEMINRSLQMFEYDDLPPTIPKKEMEYLAQSNGFTFITKADDGNLYAFYGGLGGEPNAYYLPTIITIANPYLRFNKVCKIDEDGVLLWNDSMLQGLNPIHQKYASLLAEAIISLRCELVNRRTQSVLCANDTSSKASAEKYIKDLEVGKIGVIATKTFFNDQDGIKAINLNTSNNNLTDIIETIQYIKASYFNELGVQSNWNNKRESLNDAEIGMNTDALIPLIDDMLERREIAVKKINEMFGTKIKVRLSSTWKLLREQYNRIDAMTEDDGGDHENDDSERIE